MTVKGGKRFQEVLLERLCEQGKATISLLQICSKLIVALHFRINRMQSIYITEIYMYLLGKSYFFAAVLQSVKKVTIILLFHILQPFG